MLDWTDISMITWWSAKDICSIEKWVVVVTTTVFNSITDSRYSLPAMKIADVFPPAFQLHRRFPAAVLSRRERWTFRSRGWQGRGSGVRGWQIPLVILSQLFVYPYHDKLILFLIHMESRSLKITTFYQIEFLCCLENSIYSGNCFVHGISWSF